MADPLYSPQDKKIFNMIDNYLYLFHTRTYILLPTYPESIQDRTAVNFSSVSPLARSAPIYSWSSSGPRQMQINLSLHRDMMTQINYGVSNIVPNLGDDYVDLLIKQVQAAALPRYATSQKMVDPPMIAIRFGNDIFCKGVVTGDVGVTYSLPILRNNKYGIVEVSFDICEVEPYSADDVMKLGSMRGSTGNLGDFAINRSLERNQWQASGTVLGVNSGFVGRAPNLSSRQVQQEILQGTQLQLTGRGF